MIEDTDRCADVAGAGLCLALGASGIRCRHYGGGVIEVDCDRDVDLRVVVGDLGDGLVVDVVTLRYGPNSLDEIREHTYASDVDWLDLPRILSAIRTALTEKP